MPKLPKYTQKIESDQEAKKSRVQAFVADRIQSEEDMNLMLDILRLHSTGQNLKELGEVKQEYGEQAFEKMNRELYELVTACQTDYDEIEVLIGEQIFDVGSVEADVANLDSTVEIDPEGLDTTLQINPRNQVQQVISVTPDVQVSELDATEPATPVVEGVPFVRQRDPAAKITIPKIVLDAMRREEAGGLSAEHIVDQIFDGFSEEEKEELRREFRRHEEAQDDLNEPGINPVEGRLMGRIIRSGIDVNEAYIRVKARLTGRSLASSLMGVPFVKLQEQARAVTPVKTAWEQEAEKKAVGKEEKNRETAKILEILNREFTNFTPEAEAILKAVACTRNPDDPIEVQRVIAQHAPGCDADKFRVMYDLVIRLAEKEEYDLEDVKETLWLRSQGGQVLPEMKPEKPGLDPRKQKTVMSSRGLLSRLIGRKK